MKSVQKAMSPDLVYVGVILVGRAKAGGIGVHEGWLDVMVAAAARYADGLNDPLSQYYDPSKF